MNANEASKNLKAELRAELPEIRFSVRQTRCNGWVGQVIEVHFNQAITSEDASLVNAIARLYNDHSTQVEVYDEVRLEAFRAGMKVA